MQVFFLQDMQDLALNLAHILQDSCKIFKKIFIFSATLPLIATTPLQDLVQDLASLARKYLQDLMISYKTVLLGIRFANFDDKLH